MITKSYPPASNRDSHKIEYCDESTKVIVEMFCGEITSDLYYIIVSLHFIVDHGFLNLKK